MLRIEDKEGSDSDVLASVIREAAEEFNPLGGGVCSTEFESPRQSNSFGEGIRDGLSIAPNKLLVSNSNDGGVSFSMP